MSSTRAVRPQFRRAPWKEFRLTERRLEILRYLWKRRLISTEHVRFLFGSDRVYRDLQGLHHNGYAERIEAQRALAAVYRYQKLGSLPRVYALDNRGADALQSWCGIPRGRLDWAAKNRSMKPWRIPHRLLITSAMAPFDLLARRGEIRLIERVPLEYLTPAPARSWVRPTRLEATVEREDGRRDMYVVTDNTFMVELLAPNTEPQLFFLEADRANEPNERFDGLAEDQTDLAKKFLVYDAYAAAGTALEQFGVDSFRVLTVTTSRERLANLIVLLQGLIGRGLGRFLFTDTELLKTYSDNVRALPWVNGRGEVVTLVGVVGLVCGWVHRGALSGIGCHLRGLPAEPGKRRFSLRPSKCQFQKSGSAVRKASRRGRAGEIPPA